MPLVINALRGRHRHKHTHTYQSANKNDFKKPGAHGHQLCTLDLINGMASSDEEKITGLLKQQIKSMLNTSKYPYI